VTDELTALQRKTLTLLQAAERRGERPPTYRELARELRVDVRAAFQHVVALERKGVLERRGRRGVALAPGFRPPRGVPIVGRVAAGAPLLATEHVEEGLDLAKLAGDSEDLFGLRVQGDSMVDRGILDGDLVVARRGARVEDGDIAVARIGDEATVKTVRRARGAVVLEPANRARGYAPIRLDGGEDAALLGRVVLVVRRV